MSWPWSDPAVAALQGVVDRLIEENTKLVNLIVELRREGFAPPPRTEDLDLVGADLPDSVVAAIAERDAGNPTLQRKLIDYAHAMKRRGMTDEDVRDRIYAGGDPEEDE